MPHGMLYVCVRDELFQADVMRCCCSLTHPNAFFFPSTHIGYQRNSFKCNFFSTENFCRGSGTIMNKKSGGSVSYLIDFRVLFEELVLLAFLIGNFN